MFVLLVDLMVSWRWGVGGGGGKFLGTVLNLADVELIVGGVCEVRGGLYPMPRDSRVTFSFLFRKGP